MTTTTITPITAKIIDSLKSNFEGWNESFIDDPKLTEFCGFRDVFTHKKNGLKLKVSGYSVNIVDGPILSKKEQEAIAETIRVIIYSRMRELATPEHYANWRFEDGYMKHSNKLVLKCRVGPYDNNVYFPGRWFLGGDKERHKEHLAEKKELQEQYRDYVADLSIHLLENEIGNWALGDDGRFEHENGRAFIS